MKYDEPKMEVILIQTRDVITLSVEGAGSGNDVDGEEGGWS